MDIGALQYLLNPNKTYSDVSKELFLERLEEAFEDFRIEGDSFLISPVGKSFYSHYKTDSFYTDYRFVGNKTKQYLDLRFLTEPKNDSINNLTKDICNCH